MSYFEVHLLSTVTNLTEWNIRKVVNKVFIVTIDNFGASVFLFVIVAIIKVDCAVNLPLPLGGMSS